MASHLLTELTRTRNALTLSVIALSVPCWLTGFWPAGLVLNGLAVSLMIKD